AAFEEVGGFAFGEGVDLVPDGEGGHGAGAEFVEDGAGDVVFAFPSGGGGVDDVEQDVGEEDFFERGAEGGGELGGEAVDEADGVDEDGREAGGEGGAAGGGVERGEELVLDEGAG